MNRIRLKLLVLLIAIVGAVIGVVWSSRGRVAHAGLGTKMFVYGFVAVGLTLQNQ